MRLTPVRAGTVERREGTTAGVDPFHRHESGPQPGWPIAAMVLVVLAAFAARVYDLANLTLYGDYAYSVYAARQDWITIAQERVLDSHPPLYYYLLHAWMLASGQTELTVRLLSAGIGLLVVPLTFALGARHLGRRAGLLGSLFVAVSPALVHYSRLPRMYMLLVLLAALSLYTLGRALDEGRGRDWLAYAASTCLLLYTHYYGLALLVAEAAYVVWIHRAEWHFPWATNRWGPATDGRGNDPSPSHGASGARRFAVALPKTQTARFVAALGGLAMVYLPWLLYAAAGSASATARIISNAPWPTDVQGVAEQFWIPFVVGDFLATDTARPLALVVLALLLALVFVERRRLRHLWPSLRLLLSGVVAPVTGSLVVFIFVPYAVRPRFLLFVIPPFFLLVAALLNHERRWLVVGSTTLILVISGYAIVAAYGLEPYVVESDAIRLTERLEATAQPDDAVVFHAFWQIGYFTTHYHGTMPRVYALSDLATEKAVAGLSSHPRVWLAMFRAPARTPEYPLEEWLDRHWHKAQEVQLGETRLLSYVRPSQGPWQDMSFTFADPERGPVLALSAAQLGSSVLKPREALAVGLRWETLQTLAKRYTVFVQLVDGEGRSVVGADSDPLGGSEPTMGWTRGRTVEDRLAVVIPAVIPPGDYRVRAGLHLTGEPQALPARNGSGATLTGGVDIGGVSVGGYGTQEPPMRHGVDARIGDRIALLGYDLDLDSYVVGTTRTVVALTDNPIQLTLPKRAYAPSETVRLTLYWRALGPVDQEYTVFTHLVDDHGRLWGQADSPPLTGRYPTRRWPAGEVIADEHDLPIDPATPAGDYAIRVGLYLLSTMERLPAVTGGGVADAVVLRPVRIEIP